MSPEIRPKSFGTFEKRAPDPKEAPRGCREKVKIQKTVVTVGEL